MSSNRKRLLEVKTIKPKSYATSGDKSTFKGPIINVQSVSKIGKKKDGGTFPSEKTYILFHINEIEGGLKETEIHYFKTVDKKIVKMDEDDLKKCNAERLTVKVGDTISVKINRIEAIEYKYGTMNNVYAKLEYNDRNKVYDIYLYCDGISGCSIPSKLEAYKQYYKPLEMKANDGFISNNLFNGLLDQLALSTERKYKFTLDEFGFSNAKEGKSVDNSFMVFKVIGPSISYLPEKDINHIISQNVAGKYDTVVPYKYKVKSIQDLVHMEMYGTEPLDDVDNVLSECLGGLETVVQVSSYTGFDFTNPDKDTLKIKMKESSFQVNSTTEKAFVGRFEFFLKFETKDKRNISYFCKSRVSELMKSLCITDVEGYESICQINSFNFRVLIWNPNKKYVYTELESSYNKNETILAESSLVQVDIHDLLKDKITLDKPRAYEFCGYNSILNIAKDKLSLTQKSFVDDLYNDKEFVNILDIKKYVLNLNSSRAQSSFKEVKNLDEYGGIYSFPDYDEVKLVFGFGKLLKIEQDPSVFMNDIGLINVHKLQMELNQNKYPKDEIKFVKYIIHRFLRVCYSCIFFKMVDSVTGDYKNLIERVDEALMYQNKCEYDSLDLNNNKKWTGMCVPITEKDISKNPNKNIISMLRIIPYAVTIHEDETEEFIPSTETEEDCEETSTDGNQENTETGENPEVNDVEDTKKRERENKNDENPSSGKKSKQTE